MKWVLMGMGLIALAACGQPESQSAAEMLDLSAHEQLASLVSDQAPLIAWDGSLRSYLLHLVDPATGDPVPGLAPIPLEGGFDYRPTLALAPDGSRLAAFTGRGPACEAYAGGSACRASASQLQWIDMLEWREHTYPLPLELPTQAWVWPVTFSPDGSLLAAAYHDRNGSGLLLFDVKGAELRGPTALDLRPSQLAFSSDRSTLVVFGARPGDDPGISPPHAPRVLVVDLASMKVVWDQSLPDILSGSWCLENCTELHRSGEPSVFAYYEPGIVYSPARDSLLILHADSDRLTTVDIQSRQVTSVEIPADNARWFERLLRLFALRAEAKGYPEGAMKRALLSADGSKLYWIGRSWQADADAEDQADGRPLGLHMIDLDRGREVGWLDLAADVLRMSPDGKHLILSRWDRGTPEYIITDLVRSDGLEWVATVEGWDILPAVSPTGSPTYLAFGLTGAANEETALAALDSQSLELLTPWMWPALAFWGTSQ